MARGRALLGRGSGHLLLAGEHARLTRVEYLVERVCGPGRRGALADLEVQVWATTSTGAWSRRAATGIVVYQETYDPETYRRVHLKGKKRNFEWRLRGPEPRRRAGMRRVGLGALLGLHHDWRYEAIVARRPRPGPDAPVVADPGHGRAAPAASLGRRLPAGHAGLRRRVRPAGLRAAAAAPRRRHRPVDPGAARVPGRSGPARRDPHQRRLAHRARRLHAPRQATEQFEIADTRPAAEVADRLRELGYEPVWEDWGSVLPATERMLARR